MNKYLQVLKISFQQEIVYKLNFIMWRVRNVVQILIALFLWESIFSDPGRELFGYGRQKILSYVFGIIFIRAFVLSARAVDVAGEIARGEISNYLLKPVNYFRYWLTRDVASKALNLIFALIEALILYFIFRPEVFIQTDPLNIVAFLISTALAMFIYFMILFLTSSVPFWFPEIAWGAQFLVTSIFIEFLSGGLFPLDVLPKQLLQIINLTPFPYLIFFPIQVYLGKIGGIEIVRGLGISLAWIFILIVFLRNIWSRGLKVYQAYGR